MKKLAIYWLTFLLGASAAAAQGAVSFQGKTVSMIIGFSVGGGTDAYGRLVGQFLEKYLPGSPTVVPQNIPGADGVTAMNYMVQQAAHDGLAVTTTANTTADPLNYRKPQAQYKPNDFAIVGGGGRGGEVLLINKESEKRLYDKGASPVVVGSLGGIPRSGMQMAAWGIEYLGWNGKWVIGYPGTNELMLALERGEIEMTATGNIFLVQSLTSSGKFKILVQSGSLQGGKFVGRSDFGNAPVFSNLIEGKIKDPLGAQAFEYWSSIISTDKWMALPPKTPKAIVDAHRAAYAQLMKDPEFVEKGAKISEGFQPTAAADVEVLVRRLAGLPPEATGYMTVILRKQGLDVQ